MKAHNTTTGKRYPSREPEYRAKSHQEKRRQSDPLPDAAPCPVCGVPIHIFGMGAHTRRHILDGDLPEPEGFVRGREPSSRAHHIPNLPIPVRQSRKAFVDSIAKLPYREFIERLLEPWER